MSSIPSPHVKIWVQSHMHESPALTRWRQMDPKCFLVSQPSWIRFSEKLVWKYRMNRGRWRLPVSITGLHKFMHIHKNMYTDTHRDKCKIDKNKMTAVPVYTIISRDQCHTHSYNRLKCFPSKDCLQLSLVQPWLPRPRQGCRVGSHQTQSALTHLITGCSFDWSLILLTLQVGEHAHLRQPQNKNNPSSTCAWVRVPITEEKLSPPQTTLSSPN